jgi:hypothetical protein
MVHEARGYVAHNYTVVLYRYIPYLLPTATGNTTLATRNPARGMLRSTATATGNTL